MSLVGMAFIRSEVVPCFRGVSGTGWRPESSRSVARFRLPATRHSAAPAGSLRKKRLV